MSRKKAEWHGCRECGCKHNGECDEQLAAKDAEIERRRGLIHDMTNALRRANEKNDAAEARVKKLEEALRMAPHKNDCPARLDKAVRLDYAEAQGMYDCNCGKDAALAQIEKGEK